MRIGACGAEAHCTLRNARYRVYYFLYIIRKLTNIPIMVIAHEIRMSHMPKSSYHKLAIPKPNKPPKNPANAIAIPISFFLIFIFTFRSNTVRRTS